ncbi:hypothetical protein ACWDKQ_07320 [Saccharopolyspora sp. NPDC000995]
MAGRGPGRCRVAAGAVSRPSARRECCPRRPWPGCAARRCCCSRRLLRAQEIDLEVTEAAKKRLTKRGFKPEFGARPLLRTIRTELDNRISKLLLRGEAQPGDTTVASIEGDELVCALARPHAADVPA